jgi:hypothetical protein
LLLINRWFSDRLTTSGLGIVVERTAQPRIEYNQSEAMPRRTIDFDTVRRLARELGDVEDSTIHGAPSLKVRGKLLACIPVHKSAESGSLAVRIDFDHRGELIATAPDVYYLTDHYVNYPTVLVRLSRIKPDALKDLLGMAWSFVTRRRPTRRNPVK